MWCAKREQFWAKFSSAHVIFLKCAANENRDRNRYILPCLKFHIVLRLVHTGDFSEASDFMGLKRYILVINFTIELKNRSLELVQHPFESEQFFCRLRNSLKNHFLWTVLKNIPVSIEAIRKSLASHLKKSPVGVKKPLWPVHIEQFSQQGLIFSLARVICFRISKRFCEISAEPISNIFFWKKLLKKVTVRKYQCPL